MQICSQISSLPNTSWAKPTWWHTPSRSSAGISTSMHINAGRLLSTRTYVGRVNKQVCDHSGWTSIPLRCPSRQLKSINLLTKSWTSQAPRSKDYWANHENDLHHQTLWRPHRHSSGPNTPNPVHHRAPVVWSLHYPCQGGVGRLTSNMYADRLNMVAIMARPTTLMQCLRQDWQTSNHGLIRTEDHRRTHRT